MKLQRTTPGLRPGAAPHPGATPDEKNHRSEIIQTNLSSDKPNGRSAKFPTHYLGGTLHGHDVYWHPQMGYAIERNGQLAELTDLASVKWNPAFLQKRRDLEETWQRAEIWHDHIGHAFAYSEPLRVGGD